MFLTRLGLEHDFVKILDFGLVSRAKGCYRQNESRLTGVNEIVGTPSYMSPEMAAGENVDARADLYALGCVAYWLLTGTTVFDASKRTPMQILADHMKTDPDSPSRRLGVPLPGALEDLVLRLLAKNPADRPASALALKAELEALDLDDSWTQTHAGRWWQRNLRELAAPARSDASDATTIMKELAVQA
jgi:serine/threonine-protein kinase